MFIPTGKALAVFACAGLLASATAAHAHPHAWIESRADVVFNDAGKIIALNIAWVFDKDYSEMAIDGLDSNKDGFYSAGELQPLAQANIEALKEYNYFVYSYANGKKVAYGDIAEYGQIHSGGTLKMHFTIPLKQPVDPLKAKFSFKMYDPSFYIAIDFAKDTPIAALGAKPKPCRLELGKVAADAETEKTRKFLADKDKEWQPDTEEEFGALFAQPVRVVCKPDTS